ncbi:hypothetical protein [Corynebacterium sp. 335C]
MQPVHVPAHRIRQVLEEDREWITAHVLADWEYDAARRVLVLRAGEWTEHAGDCSVTVDPDGVLAFEPPAGADEDGDVE